MILNAPVEQPSRCCSTAAGGYTQKSQLLLPESYQQDPLHNHEKYLKVTDLGVGGSSFVALAENVHTKQQVAIKFVSRASSRCKPAVCAHCCCGPCHCCNRVPAAYAALLCTGLLLRHHMIPHECLIICTGRPADNCMREQAHAYKRLLHCTAVSCQFHTEASSVMSKSLLLTINAACSIKNVGKEVLHQRLCSMHPNIVKFQEVFLTNTHFCIVNEYAPGGDLVDLIAASNVGEYNALSEDRSRWLFQQVIVAVDYCHQVSSWFSISGSQLHMYSACLDANLLPEPQ